jgi:hypothetical protein
VSPADHDDVRAAAALLASVARGNRRLPALVLDADPDADRAARGNTIMPDPVFRRRTLLPGARDDRCR